MFSVEPLPPRPSGESTPVSSPYPSRARSPVPDPTDARSRDPDDEDMDRTSNADPDDVSHDYSWLPVYKYISKITVTFLLR